MVNEKLFTVGELAKRCGVTIRTLQFYDKEGILSPRHFTEGGRRLYDHNDIIRLQQILFLKSFGFSLAEIREKLSVVQSPDQLGDILTKQKSILLEQISNIQEVIVFLDKIILETKKGSYVSSEKLVMLMEMMKQGIPYTFVLRYFDQNQTKNLVYKLNDGELNNGGAFEWEAIFKELIEMYKNGVSPESDEGQELVDRWWKMVQKYTDGDPEMIKSLIKMGEDVDNWPEDVIDLKFAVKEFLEKAFNKYFRMRSESL